MLQFVSLTMWIVGKHDCFKPLNKAPYISSILKFIVTVIILHLIVFFSFSFFFPKKDYTPLVKIYTSSIPFSGRPCLDYSLDSVLLIIYFTWPLDLNRAWKLVFFTSHNRLFHWILYEQQPFIKSACNEQL